MMPLRFLCAVLLLLSAVSMGATAPVRFSTDVGLVGIMGGPLVLVGGTGRNLWLDARGHLSRVAIGIETSRGIGFVAGATLAEVGLSDCSVLPVGIKAYWVVDPSERWKRKTIYLTAAYHHKAFWSDFHWYDPFVEFGAGVAYMYYAVTPKVEVSVRPGREAGPSVRLFIGFDLGGTYVFGKASEQDGGLWGE